LVVSGQDADREKVQVAATQRVEFPQGGVLHLKNSLDDVNIEGWDRPEMEITTVETTQEFYGPESRELAKRQLNELRVTAERHGDEMVVSTIVPRRKGIPLVSPNFSNRVSLECRIKVPFAARVIVEHGNGEVHLENVTGDIQATVRRGGITLELPADAQYKIDAQSKLGAVISDIPGQQKRVGWLGGHRFTHDSAAVHSIRLRVGFGDIIILKLLTAALISTSD
jgi:hypothetical protein